MPGQVTAPYDVSVFDQWVIIWTCVFALTWFTFPVRRIKRAEVSIGHRLIKPVAKDPRRLVDHIARFETSTDDFEQ